MILEEVFVSDNIFLNFVVLLNLYWYIGVGIFVPALYYIFLKIFTFPLITRKAHEFVLILSPESVKIKKITARLTPFFYFKQGAYWFDTPAKDVDSLNHYHIYIEGINQSITKRERLQGKVHDLIKEIKIPKQISTHKILLPINIKRHLHRHFALIISENGEYVSLIDAPQRQPLRVSFFHTLGVYLQKKVQTEKPLEGEGQTTNTGNLQLLQLNTQMVLEQIEFASQIRSYSSHFIYRVSKKIQATEKNWMTWVTGGLDPKVVGTLIALMGVFAGIFLVFYVFGNPKAALGPMPME